MHLAAAVDIKEEEVVPSGHHPALTARDVLILHDIWLYRYVLSSQVCRLHFSNLKVAQRRLRILHHLGYVDRFRIGTDFRRGFNRWYYRLAGPGCSVVASANALPISNIRPPARPPRSGGYLRHHNLLTGFRIWLREACTARAFGYDFVPAYEEIASGRNRSRRVTIRIPSRRRTLVPDGAFRLQSTAGVSATFAVEIDCDTEPLRGKHLNSIEKKLRLYAWAYDHRLESTYTRLFGHDVSGFRVLCIVPSERRRRGILAVAESVDLKPLVWVGLHKTIDLPGDLDAAVWLRSPHGRFRSLLE